MQETITHLCFSHVIIIIIVVIVVIISITTTTPMFVIVDLQRVFCTQYIGIFVPYLCIKFNLCILIVSLAIAKELRANAALQVANILLFYILHMYCVNKSGIFLISTTICYFRIAKCVSLTSLMPHKLALLSCCY